MTIDLNLSPDQQDILDSVGKALTDHFPVARLRDRHRLKDQEHAGLQALAELGLFGLALPESAGGAGFTVLEEALAFVALGRHLVHPSALATVLAARMAWALGEAELTHDLVAGRRSVCMANALAPMDVGDLDGLPLHLLDPQPGGLALLWSEEGMVLLSSDAVKTQALQATDRSTPLWQGKALGAAVIGRLGESQALVRLAHLLNASMLLGMAEACLDMAVDYAKLRVQFGRPIGSFQAIKHRCANMAIGAEALRAQLNFAALALRDGWPDAGFQADACRLLAARCALANAAANIQIHGGLGFTAECDAHLYLLRAHLCQHLGGSMQAARARLASPIQPGRRS